MLPTVNVVYGNVFYIVRIAKLAWLQLLAFLRSTWGANGAVETAGVMARSTWGATGAVETAGVMAERSILQPNQS